MVAINESSEWIASPLNKKKQKKTEEIEEVCTHRYGVKPLGNIYTDIEKGISNCKPHGLGRLHPLDDSTVLQILSYLEAKDLCKTSLASRACYVFTCHDEIWRVLVLESFKEKFLAGETWRETYFKTWRKNFNLKLSYVYVEGFYSDLLYHPFRCANTPLQPRWLAMENVDRRQNMTLEEFQNSYEIPNLPVIVTDVAAQWPAISKWTKEYLIQHARNATFSAGGFQLTLQEYFKYKETLKDDQPLYLFDSQFIAKVPQLENDFQVPIYFQDDLFSLLDTNRPDYRWLIVGPSRSGSSFHIDPNSTSAWNAVVKGRKKWILFPPSCIPPGVHPSNDGADVSTPVSVVEWFLNFYEEARQSGVPFKECIVEEGEVIFVPRGWWHLVLNLQDSIAITQNFVSRINVPNVLKFLKTKGEQISGCSNEFKPKLYLEFYKRVLQAHPDLQSILETKESSKTWSSITLEQNPFQFKFF